jgi:integrase
MAGAMMLQKLTNRMIQNMGPGDTFWDTSITGLGVRCQKRSRSFVFKYRVEGRQRLITIGRFGVITLEQARKHAQALAGEVAMDRDPATKRDESKAIPTVREATRRFLNEHVEAKRKSKTAYEYRLMIERLILPALGDKRIDRVTRQDAAALHDSLRATPHQANRVLAVLSKLFNWCESRGMRPEGPNPTQHVEKFRENRRERFLSELELAMLGQTLAESDEQCRLSNGSRGASTRHHGLASPFAAAAIRLLIFSGARVGEILKLRWDDIDLERGLIFLPDSKTGQKPLIITPPMAAVLTGLPRLAGNPYIIAGGNPGTHLVDLERPWRRIRDRTTVNIIRGSDDIGIRELLSELDQETAHKAALSDLDKLATGRGVCLPTGLSDVRLHDLRHTFASYAAGMGHSLQMIGRLLGHTQPATTARYAHLAQDPVQVAANTTSNRIANLLSKQDAPEEDHGSVVRFKKT